MEQKIKILIIEDEALIAQNLKYTLEDLGYEVVNTCYNYQEGLTAIKQDDADLIMLDINLGSATAGRTGLDLARAMQQTGIARPFIFLTAYNDMDTIRQATRLAPSGYMIKPVNPATIFATIQTAIERHNLQHSETPDDVSSDLNKSKLRPEFFFVKMGTRNIKIWWQDVIKLEAGKNYVKIKLKDSHAEYPVRGTLHFVAEQLIPENLQGEFLRINRSLIVNHRAITAYHADWVACGDERYENTRYSVRELNDLLGRGK